MGPRPKTHIKLPGLRSLPHQRMMRMKKCLREAIICLLIAVFLQTCTVLVHGCMNTAVPRKSLRTTVVWECNLKGTCTFFRMTKTEHENGWYPNYSVDVIRRMS